MGHWDKVKFIKSEPLDHVVQSYKEQLAQVKTYFGVFKKFHAKDLPKTNYDLLYEERVNLESEFCEF